MILLLHREYNEDSYSFVESFSSIQEVVNIKGDVVSSRLVEKMGFRSFFVTEINIYRGGVKSVYDDDRGTHLVYLDIDRQSEFSGEALKAWSDYRDSKINTILNKDSV